MNPKTRAKIQEALDCANMLVSSKEWPTTSLVIRQAIEALAAEPDEPTVSKSVEKLVFQWMDSEL